MTGRFLNLIGLVAFAVAISGGGRALHVSLEHAHATTDATHSCHDAPDERRPSQPSPEKEECEVCFTISSSTKHAFDVAADADDPVGPEACIGIVRPRGVATPAPRLWSSGPPRAPPVHA